MIQVDGIFVQQGGGGPVIPDFTYTGEYQLVNEAEGNWKIYFDTSGTFVSNVDMSVDAFCVGGGGGGGNGIYSYDNPSVRGGAGGGGGKTGALPSGRRGVCRLVSGMRCDGGRSVRHRAPPSGGRGPAHSDPYDEHL